MTAIKFPKDKQDAETFFKTISDARIQRYLDACDGNITDAVELYLWGARISQAFYLPLQIWEITLRNRLNSFLIWKYGPQWPFDEKKAVRQIKMPYRSKIAETIENLTNEDDNLPSTDSVVADLSAGFWVHLLGTGYHIPFKWQYKLDMIFPEKSGNQWRKGAKGFDATEPHEMCEDILNVRNRVAHHEPLAWMDLADIHSKICTVVEAMCSSSSAYLNSCCTVQSLLEEGRNSLLPIAAPS